MEENTGVHTSLDADELDNPPDEIIPTLQSATIDCSSENYTEQSQPSPGERQRPIRNASRPTRYRDATFDTQFQPMPRRHRRIRRREATGNYVTKEEYFRLGRGVKRKHPRSPPGPVETSTVSKKRLSSAALQFSSTTLPPETSAHSSAAINKTVRPTTAAGGRLAATPPAQKAKVNPSKHGKTDTTSVSIPGKIQTVSIDCPTMSTQQNTSLQPEIHPRRFRRKKRQKHQQQTQQE